MNTGHSVNDVVVVVGNSIAALTKPLAGIVGRSPSADCRAHPTDFAGREEVAVFLETTQHAMTRLMTLQHRLNGPADLQKEFNPVLFNCGQ